MRAAFKLFDPDGEGVITQEGLKNTLKTLGKQATDAELRTLIGGDVSGMFTARGGKIDYEMFCKIYKGELKKDTAQITDLQEAFRMMDPDGKGHIEATQLQFICKKLGEDLTIQEVKEMVGEALIGFDGRIFYDGYDVALPGRDHHLEGCIHGEAPLRQLRPKGSAIAWERVERALSPSG